MDQSLRLLRYNDGRLGTKEDTALMWRDRLYQAIDGAGLRESPGVPECHQWLFASCRVRTSLGLTASELKLSLPGRGPHGAGMLTACVERVAPVKKRYTTWSKGPIGPNPCVSSATRCL